jgi:hypothetical protein
MWGALLRHNLENIAMPIIKFKGKTLDLDQPIFGAKAIGELCGRSERQIFHSAAEGHFTHRKTGKLLVTTPREVLTPLLGDAGVARLIVEVA